MKPKTYLMQYQTAKYEYEEAREQYLAIRADAESIPGMRYDRDKIQSSSQSDLSDVVIAIMKAEAVAEKKYKQYLEKLTEIRQVIDDVEDPKYRELLKRRYLNNQPFEEISEQMGYDLGTIYIYHGWALTKVHVPANC